MRYSTRFTICLSIPAFLVLLSILIITTHFSSRSKTTVASLKNTVNDHLNLVASLKDTVSDQFDSVIGREPRRLIVLGDFWADNGKYLTNPLEGEKRIPKDPVLGLGWTSWLCKEVCMISSVLE
jgi:hypothetical protein